MFDIKLFRKENNLTQQDLANYFGCKQSFISGIERGNEKIPDSYISKIKADPEMKWSFVDKESDLTPRSGVPYYDIDISASLTESFLDIAEAPEFYVDFKPFNDCSAYLPVFGDSMYPMISSGEIVALKKVDNPEYIQYGEAHLVITNAESNNMRTLKIIRKHQNDEMIILKPENPNFDELVIPRSTILSLYIVKGKITRKQL